MGNSSKEVSGCQHDFSSTRMKCAGDVLPSNVRHSSEKAVEDEGLEFAGIFVHCMKWQNYKT